MDHVDMDAGKKRKRSASTRSRKRKNVTEEDETVAIVPEEPVEDDTAILPAAKKSKKWKNKTRVLIVCARGVTFRSRHLMKDLRALLPHSRTDNKIDHRERREVLNELCEMKNCTKCIFLEMRKKKDLYMWISQAPNGPSAKFLVENVHTMDELKMTGNALLGSRPLLSFDPGMTSHPHYRLLHELFSQVFSTPYYHPKSKPFVDHVFHFGLADNHLWFRNYQIVEDGRTLTEIGPRFTLNLIKIFDGSFGGATLYENSLYQTPNAHRRVVKQLASQKYKLKVKHSKERKERRKEEQTGLPVDPLADVFDTRSH